MRCSTANCLQLIVLINLLSIQHRLRNLASSLLNLLRHALGRSSRRLLRHITLDLALARARRVNTMAAILLDELGEVLDRARTLVRDWAILLAGWVQLDGGETLDLVWHVVEGGVDLGDGDFVGEGLEELA